MDITVFISLFSTLSIMYLIIGLYASKKASTNTEYFLGGPRIRRSRSNLYLSGNPTGRRHVARHCRKSIYHRALWHFLHTRHQYRLFAPWSWFCRKIAIIERCNDCSTLSNEIWITDTQKNRIPPFYRINVRHFDCASNWLKSTSYRHWHIK